ncbi:hypothetical protein SASPL_158038 [Salvia splendens]|uniref:BOD1/SHG1 domain-containing protein n=1 Tax=Salvia splendens TaxID=180675 RepID=A0A8X8VTW4_SALSN|nr:hypothetical protein SASPL_158038 [Salvia splendens]
MIDTGSNGSGGRVKPEVVISTLKDDGDFDRLRRKTIRKLKDDEELRSNIISMVKQSAALSRPGVESMKPRQLSDAIHQEIGAKLMNQISDGLWNIIKSADGMQSEIKETVRSVYDKLSNPGGKDNGESSSRKDSSPGNKLESRDAAGAFAAKEPDNLDYDAPPGFSSLETRVTNSHDIVLYDGKHTISCLKALFVFVTFEDGRYDPRGLCLCGKFENYKYPPSFDS